MYPRTLNLFFNASMSSMVVVLCLISMCDDETDDLALSRHSAQASAQTGSEFFETFQSQEKMGNKSSVLSRDRGHFPK